MQNEADKASLFPRTMWSQLGKAAGADIEELDRVIRLYWAPLRIFLTSTFPSLTRDADLVLQEFAEDRILKKDWLRRADPTRGRFRDFLKTSLRNFALDRLNRYEARHPPLTLDDIEGEHSGPQRASEAFDLSWVRTVLAQTLERMEADCKNPTETQPRRGNTWEMFRIRILGPILEETAPVPYEELVSRFELRSPSDASNMLLSGKRIFKMHLTRVIEEYGERDSATALEVRALAEFVQRLASKT
jgi:hypothetical protein